MSKAIQLYKQLHRTTKIVFKDDFASIGTVSAKIRGEFEKNRNVKNEAAIEELLKFGQESDEILRKFVLQIEQVDETTYRTHIRYSLQGVCERISCDGSLILPKF